jgi:transcription termination factor Rho
MTNNDYDEPLRPTPAAIDPAPTPARKRAAKKTAVKTAASQPAAVTKTPARKSAHKKASTSEQTGELPLFVAAPQAAPAPARKMTARVTAKVAAASNNSSNGQTAIAAPARSSEVVAASSSNVPHTEPVTQAPADGVATAAPSAAPAPRRIGRVPGGGAVTPRELSKSPKGTRKTRASAAPQTSLAAEVPTPAPAPVPIPVPAPAPAAAPEEATAAPSPPTQQPQQPNPSNGESRSKRRREKRKQHRNQGQNRHQGQHRHQNPPHADSNSNRPDPEANRQVVLTGPKLEANGMLELAPKSFGFLRVPKKNFEQARDDVFVPPEMIRRHNLRIGQWIHGLYQEGSRGPQLVEITRINGLAPEEAAKLPHFDELKAINPNKRLSFETTPERFTTRVIDIMTPVGRGQRGLIVSPPRSGKTTMLLHTAEAVRDKYSDSLHLMILLVDERPEEVTEFRRALPGAEIYASSNDEVARNHCRIAELAIERAKRLVEAGKDVFLLMDSITRLARAYNATMNNVGRGTGSGGITIGALEVPRRLFAAARNTRGGGSLTILATALIQTNSRADEAIFLEFKGTGNMELVLDRKIAENYIYPAVDIFKSGTRREELLLPEHMLHKIHLIRRGLAGHRPVEAMERLLFFLKKFSNNPQMLLEIKG